MLVVKNPPASAGDVKDTSSILSSGRSPGGGHGNSLQYSCPENPQGQRSLAGPRVPGSSPGGSREFEAGTASMRIRKQLLN